MSDTTRTVFLDSGEQLLELQKYQLRVVGGEGEHAQAHVFEARKVQIGSSPENDLVLDDPAVSRFHAVIEVDERGYLLRDTGSKNGTFVGKLGVREIYLSDGCVFRVGNTEVNFTITEVPAEVHFSNKTHFGKMLGGSLVMREMFSMLERVAPTDATVLIEGESGTGKELVAEALHAHSARKDGPFIVIDCSAIARDLIESELFGHIKGAFTGATGTRQGAFEAADGGTLFLDELGELDRDLQPKLLRALEKREIKPVGSNTTIKTNVRVVAATNRRLIHEVKEGNFREDLYFRLAVIKVEMPPLRERPEDIPVLVEHFLGAANEMAGRDGVDVSYKTMEKLKRHRWPGNVRELKNFVERAVLLTHGDQIETRFLQSREPVDEKPPVVLESAASMAGLALEQGLPFKDAKNRLIEEFEKSYWMRLLEQSDGNVSEAARIAGVHRKSVEYILKKLDISRDDLGS
ncbi:sigma 54-interacting transcriptional regulator [Bradymonas sediminis]|uniref:Fis family transcriptional regulator n=1 Tax=Bradymonas sediminis TaxID=1548548 RepID=A0A2Z4FH68_9DELT|nr:sigma 54-interacting transcriptional regulator [Bradymonas sediminis]AWV87966.1 Fis family transcriptional regulator [Bradymonas sediminis]TDP62985.1 DNA-binding NtrC family response regulator [Bradymonas sediminis]